MPRAVMLSPQRSTRGHHAMTQHLLNIAQAAPGQNRPIAHNRLRTGDTLQTPDVETMFELL